MKEEPDGILELNALFALMNNMPLSSDEVAVENKKRQLNFNTIAGVDEAGRGPWAGPVYSAIVILNKDRIPKGINDSKKVSEKYICFS